jgi:hypothetical protein
LETTAVGDDAEGEHDGSAGDRSGAGPVTSDLTAGGAVYAKLIGDQLASETKRRDSLNTRAGSLTSVSAGLVTLVFALSAAVYGEDSLVSGTARWFVGASVILLLVSAVLGVMASQLLPSEVPSYDAMEKMIGQDAIWNEDPEQANRIVAWWNLQTCKTLRDGNNRKTTWLGAGLVAQGCSVAMLIVAVIALLAH